ncbi:1409_t:CDS:2, partial [Rhizophagus irregularis]
MTETTTIIDQLLRQELKHVMHRDVDKFLDLLFLIIEEHKCVVGRILEECKKGRKWKEGKWIEFPRDGSKEKDFYSPFALIANFVIQRAVKRKPDIVLFNRNHVIQKRYEEVVYWSNIHVIEEIKRTCQSDNISTDLELAGYVWEIFGNQHNRRFVLGFTLCGGFMRVWLFDRSGGISLNRIDIYHDPTMFIRVITGFATMELFQLGYDTTIMDLLLRLGCIEIEKWDKQRPENKKTERFALIETIFHRAVISGRETICWRAYHLDEDGKEMTDKEFVIKDSWRSISRKNTEGNLLKKATNALKHIPDTQIVKYYHHEDVTLIDGNSQDKNVDDTFTYIRKQLHLFLDSISSNNMTTARENCSNENYTSDRSSGRSKSSGFFKEQNFYFVGKTQLREPEYRIYTRLITSTCGKPIYHFNDQVELLTALYDAIEGHRNLFRIANILHGDISLYNIMIGADGRGFIIDLDYAIDLGFDQSSATDCDQKKDAPCYRTGTLPFMAIEILNHNAKHTFQHDLEFFFYVLCWICSEYKGSRGKLRARDCSDANGPFKSNQTEPNREADGTDGVNGVNGVNSLTQVKLNHEADGTDG